MAADTATDRSVGSTGAYLATVRGELDRLDRAIGAWSARYGVSALCYTLAVVFFWFGIVKPFGVSPANPVVETGIYFLPFDVFFPVLGWWEAAVGVGLLFKRTMRFAVYLMVFQMLGTMIPLFSAPAMTFTTFPFVPTEIGAYIIKNWVILSGGLVVLTKIELEDER
ncbi:hypothetical protein [Halalkalicoccus salilacus]|uniref:hypothetical protein n=1 Tax=Halalkalicoccus salilacus TaxID=3117459 RepID=UPI00300EE623